MTSLKTRKELIALIGRNWFSSSEKLAERSGVGLAPIKALLNGKDIGGTAAEKLKDFLDNYKGEVI